jgi:glycosyltransferase involved in cell wall biosynthesis
LGLVKGDEALATIYSAADVLVIPSLQEAFGQTVTEAMACGTPSVGFNVGGVPDMITEAVTGFLAPPRDVAGLARAIRKALSDEYRGRMADACRRRAVTVYDHKLQAQQFIKVYQELMRTTGPS